ncbi:MAG TPA: sugar kinase [Devosia sp.]|uniref:carbohydrate kinase family protein n=1 Tax=Devosia sp. TaxID=1871048 RepID=UPI002F94CF86
MATNSTILVVGDVMTDIIVVPEGALVRGSDRAATIRQRPGGSGANQAVWLGAMGAHVRFAGRVGQEDRCRLEEYFRDRRVEPLLAADPALPSGVLVTMVDPDGERSFLTDRGANLHLCEHDLPPSLLEGVGMVMASGYSFFEPGPRAAVQSLLRRAASQGVPSAIDPASVGFLLAVGPENFLYWTQGASWIFANEDEARTLTGSKESQEQLRLLGQHYGNVVLKRGAQGAMLGGAAGMRMQLPAPVVPVLDTTGAGDAFAAGFMATYLASGDEATALEAGIAAGSQAVQAIGGQPA